MKVVITGSSGNLGGKLLHHILSKYTNATVYALDIVPLDDKIKKEAGERVHEVICDLTKNSEDWKGVFKAGIDIVYHFSLPTNNYVNELLKSPRSWDESALCCDANFNVLVASALNEVPRVVYASSVQVMGGHKEIGTEIILDGDDASYQCGYKCVYNVAKEVYDDSTPYAVSKMVVERLARTLGENFPKTKFISFRFGAVLEGTNTQKDIIDVTKTLFGLKEGEKVSPMLDENGMIDTIRDMEFVMKWHRSCWLSNEDFLELMDLARTADLGEHKSLNFNAVTGLPGMGGTRWDMTRAIEILGFKHKQ